MGVDVTHALAQHLKHVLHAAKHAGGPARGTDALESGVDRLGNRRRPGIARMAHRLRKVGRADEEHVDPLHRKNNIQVRQRRLVFYLRRDERRTAADSVRVQELPLVAADPVTLRATGNLIWHAGPDAGPRRLTAVPCR